MKPNRTKQSFYKLFALFTVIRGYNVAVLIFAMYITAYFIFSKDTTLFHFFEKVELHLIVLASAFTISGGFIINNFYDLDKDAISRPLPTYISRFINQNFKLTVYLIFCSIALITAFLASWRVGFFFIIYNFMVWFYSHKISKITLIHNIFYVVLSMMPFLALLLFYNNYSPIIFYHGIYLGLLLLSMDIVKDLTTYQGDLIYNYQTLPVTFGIYKTKWFISFILGLSFIWTRIMTTFNEVGHMGLYFTFVSVLIILILVLIWRFKAKWQYNFIYLLLKFILGVGVLSIAWIKINPLDLQKFFPLNN
ncbi:prenyltransferase [Flavobacteriaceae bacterium Ap0902]|nr:prenyltransferase [Flavobacteriaceae bacterium Ap0902]